MLTVKHIVEHTNAEMVFTTFEVTFNPGNEVQQGCVICDGRPPFFDGLTYVMNEQGKTVAKYDLRGPAPMPSFAHTVAGHTVTMTTSA